MYIPVDLYSGEKGNELKFTLLGRRNMAPVGYRRINKEPGKEVTLEEIVKEYEREKDRYAVLSDKNFLQAKVQATQTIEIVAFIQDSETNTIYFDKSYFLTPGKAGAKGYALLREVLRRTRKIGITYLVIHTRQHLAAVMVEGKMLLLQLLRYADDLRDPKQFDIPDNDLGAHRISKKELDMAERLVESMTEQWDPRKYLTVTATI